MTTTTMKVIPVRQDLSVNRFELLDRFRYRPEKGWKWLQRLAFWFLAKLGCYAWDEKVTVQAVRIDTDKVIQNIHAQHQGLIARYHLHGKCVLIGPAEFQRLCGEMVELGGTLSFDARYQFWDRGHREVMGMKITIVPWMEGILVVPKEVLQ